jgi:hypothetical protein
MSARGKLTELEVTVPIAPRHTSTVMRAALLGLKVTGGISWMLAYREAIRSARETGENTLPGSAIAFNLVWEVIYTAGGVAKWRQLDLEDRVQTVINAVWLSYDLKLSNELRNDLKNKKTAFLIAGVYHAVFLACLSPANAARSAAFWQNLGFSAYSALFESSTAETAFANQRFTLLRAIGTAIPTATSGLARGVDPACLVPGIGCICFDIIKLRKGCSANRKTQIKSR